MTASLKLISHKLCPYVQRAVIALKEKGVPFERVEIDLASKPDWFLKLSPLGKVPVLVVTTDSGEVALFESNVICEYIEETQGARLNFPLIADHDRKVANLYGMIHPNASDTMTVRSVFVIDPNHKVRLTLTYPAATGRNFDELLRVIDSLQLTDKHKVATPGNWNQGQDVIIVPSVSNEDAAKLFPGGWTEHKPYLRTVPQPKG